MVHHTSPKIFSRADDLPVNNVGLVLGTSSRNAAGQTNLFFKYRMTAAADLWKKGKVSYLLVSGDNRMANYNEPKEMRRALMELGVPDSVITLDYAGFRTLDEVARCKEVFGQTKVTIISQEFHNYRALFLAESFGLEAVAYSTKNVPEDVAFKTIVREWFARSWAMLDVYVFGTQAKFYGKKETIGSPSPALPKGRVK